MSLCLSGKHVGKFYIECEKVRVIDWMHLLQESPKLCCIFWNVGIIFQDADILPRFHIEL